MGLVRGSVLRLLRVRGAFARRATWWVIAAIVCAVLYGQVGRWFVRPAILRQLRQMCGEGVSLGSVRFRGGRHITCRNLVIEAGEGSAYEGEMVRVEEMQGRVSLWSLVRFRPRLKRVKLSGLHVNACWDVEGRMLNLAGLMGGGVKGGEVVLPSIVVKDAVLRVSSVNGGQSRIHAAVGLSYLPDSEAASKALQTFLRAADKKTLENYEWLRTHMYEGPRRKSP